ncbi:hypothetical protein LIER_37983 [Lithospermum erythrorhizon]|uniref:RNase H type-1 domain-containing protein n=1 Tax=Lithospermum erythrorhizon TaxID=34254 RepID=A0AAV3PT05_LITER
MVSIVIKVLQEVMGFSVTIGGEVLKALTHQFQALSPFHSELLAVYDGLRLCSDLGLQQVIIETDSIQVIDCVLKRRGAWHLNYLVDQITHLIESNRHNIQHVPCKTNIVIDRLAK